MAITAQTVRELREKTGAGMMDCKKALSENGGDMEAAVDWLRAKGLSAAAKKASRIAAEGLVGAASESTVGVAVEVNAETDFVARNEHFQKYVTDTVDLALKDFNDIESFKNTSYGNERSVQEELTHLISIIGENMNLRRVVKLSVEKGVVGSYIHNAEAPGLGKIGVLVALSSGADHDKLQELAKKLAMHVAAARPLALTIEEVPAEAIERERAIYIEQALESGKPRDVAEKMVGGRLRKYYEEVALLEQGFVMDPKKKIRDVLKEASKDLGSAVDLSAFVRLELGEGIEKKEENFAAEVAAQLSK